MGHVGVVMVRELAGTVHSGGMEGCARLLLLVLVMLLHSASWSSHVIRMVVVMVMMAGGIARRQIKVGCGHAGLGHLSSAAAVNVLVDVVGVGWRLLASWRTVAEVGLVVQRGWTIAMLLLLLLRVTLTRELSREALLRIPHHAVRSSWGGFL